MNNKTDNSEDELSPEQEQVDQTSEEMEQLQQKLKEANDKALRYMAEADNARKRARTDVENAHKYSIEKFARELLHVVDTLEKGIEATSEEGVHLTHKMLLATLEKFHIKQIDPVGEDFDPSQHEALTAQETNELEPNKVLTVVQKGYLLYERVLRPARVIVAKAPA